ncbi:MAG: thiamine diphosphokinase [Bacteroidales bacterium]|nr:MAG: thiamine diphosphokinase [Bacteroidales bacterium]
MINLKLSTLSAGRKVSTVIVADGKFPEHKIPLKALADAEIVVCCDGATTKVDSYGITPTAVVGDLDSLSDSLKMKYSDRLFHEPDQNSNDLTKAIMWCLARNYTDITILGATGLREDHTLGNIGLLSKYARLGVNVKMLTDTGYFLPLLSSSTLESFKGQQVSIFSPSNKAIITTINLRYPIENRSLEEYWMGTLNESLGDSFGISFENESLIIFMTYQ